LLDQWNCAENIRAMVFDTTSANTGHLSAACISVQGAWDGSSFGVHVVITLEKSSYQDFGKHYSLSSPKILKSPYFSGIGLPFTYFQ